ncbi:hypothetical protein LX32DRAFT_347687 [Colletotrichum zoysiae]|uniref:Uncharacterized protein n=1 Tax=Colletotrichum zoysiae TaxID=1216348 RepID=A0AAD9HK56_9PEZI|nr:hypothetical protein LX32DRAFT_347687 [Colletotrichum zoysiae]
METGRRKKANLDLAFVGQLSGSSSLCPGNAHSRPPLRALYPSVRDLQQTQLNSSSAVVTYVCALLQGRHHLKRVQFVVLGMSSSHLRARSLRAPLPTIMRMYSIDTATTATYVRTLRAFVLDQGGVGFGLSSRCVPETERSPSSSSSSYVVDNAKDVFDLTKDAGQVTLHHTLMNSSRTLVSRTRNLFLS